MAVGIIGCVLFVKKAQWAKADKQDELAMYYMKYHKVRCLPVMIIMTFFLYRITHPYQSFGLLMAAAAIPRVGYLLVSKRPAHLAAPAIQQLAATVSHLSLYGFMIFMPVTGILMGYFGGKGDHPFSTSSPLISPTLSPSLDNSLTNSLIHSFTHFLAHSFSLTTRSLLLAPLQLPQLVFLLALILRSSILQLAHSWKGKIEWIRSWKSLQNPQICRKCAHFNFLVVFLFFIHLDRFSNT